ncbi:Error-prone DNA polymerase [Paraburkholderia fynbosensis]|uniref:Error-prone DNA polymerase n=1 Tax=Paraburkholderia fynbosensis TaxID=1200993 RepID=A0A6J5H1Q9_9BURK|nr:Error-prone DNA polymerase [Paraburkholderia fynbosensis]
MLARPIRPPLTNSTTSQYKQYFVYLFRSLFEPYRDKAFESVSDLARRAQLDQKDLHVLADANALASLAGNRREALWQSVAAVPDKDMLAIASVRDETPELGAPSEAHDIVADYRSVGLTWGGTRWNCSGRNCSRTG